jgi:hypothetical protein
VPKPTRAAHSRHSRALILMTGGGASRRPAASKPRKRRAAHVGTRVGCLPPGAGLRPVGFVDQTFGWILVSIRVQTIENRFRSILI